MSLAASPVSTKTTRPPGATPRATTRAPAARAGGSKAATARWYKLKAAPDSGLLSHIFPGCCSGLRYISLLVAYPAGAPAAGCRAGQEDHRVTEGPSVPQWPSRAAGPALRLRGDA